MASSISVSSWIRKRFDSSESDHNGQPIPESPEPQECSSEGGSNKVTSLCYETETEKKTRGITTVKSQWQRAVRKLSANSSGYGSSNDPSPSGSRTSIEKPSWALKQRHHDYQPRSRHLSINVDNGGVYQYHPKSYAQPIPESRPVHYQRSHLFQPSSLPPYAGQMPMSPPKNNQTTEDAKVVEQTNTENITKSRTPSGGSSSNDGETSCSSTSGSGEEVEKLTEEFPYGPAFRAAMGRVTAFPDGTEAVMIDSAMALEAFRIDQMKLSMREGPNISSKQGYARRNSLDQPEIRRRTASLSTPHRASDIHVGPDQAALLFRDARGVSI
jgi:hypothetical protein